MTQCADPVRGFHRFSRGVLNIFLTPWICLRVRGEENLPQSGGYVLACSHTSPLDGILAFWYMARRGVPLRIMAKAELFRLPVVGAIFRALHLVPVDRKAQNRSDALAPVCRAIDEGQCVAIYPEGTFTEDPDVWPMRLKTGVARVALDTRAPVIPLASWGAHMIMSSGRIVDIRPARTVDFLIGEAVDLSDLYSELGSADRKAVEEANRRIYRALCEGLAQLRGENPPENMWWDPREGRRIPLISSDQ
ncbi:lysophospholipid acyltransferase family protein [Schaalia sp. lx-260]|uniref:lysophospholipid acyltransferase family protein n=1 Tax=Schaalia sp. lx-260 TaxID=2899082 RepID=UPI001E3D28B6|nr:lysophospholipid acyltransferase family protein [Schaalia sp. lx-260]MCD4549605.1 1-acyl-sn-glycerol-3-phosphate acyltransferase [Schaalia sp. lx-260]